MTAATAGVDRKLRVAVLPGDAPGARDAVEMALAVLDRAGVRFEALWQDVGEQRYLRTGELLPAEVLAQVRASDAVFCGSPPASDRAELRNGELERGIVFGLRRQLSLAINLREFQSVTGAGDHRITVVRENSEGLYFNEGFTVQGGTQYESSVEVASSTYAAARRCAQFAFELASARGSRLTLAHKAKVLVHSGQVWRRAFEETAADFPDVKVSVENVDTCCGLLVADPSGYDVIVTDNLFGDILSDVACARLGAFEHSYSVELTARSDAPSLFEPMHGPQGIASNGHRVSPYASLGAVAALARNVGLTAIGAALGQATLESVRQQVPVPGLADFVCAATAERLAAGNDGPGTAI